MESASPTDHDADRAPSHAAAVRRRLLAVALAIPVLSSAIGIDGGAMFQIAASEELGLDPGTIGLGLGLGMLSVPVQIWASRMPLERARANLRAYLVAAAVMCWVVAGIVAVAPAAGALAHSVLAVAVLAEITLSVLYVPAWQPILSSSLASGDRQRINSHGRAVGNVIMAATLLVFGSVGTAGRVAVLVVLGAVALAQALSVARLPARRPAVAGPAPPSLGSGDGPPAPGRAPIPVDVRVICATAGLLAVSMWPLLITYVHDVLWPDANLGLVATMQIGGQVAAAMLWRPTTGALLGRAVAAAVVAIGAGLALAAVRVPVDGGVEAAVALLAPAVAAAAATVIALVVLELAHRGLDDGTSVRALTILDVIASTSAQGGLLLAGFLIAASAGSTWAVDPYRLYLLATAAALAAALVGLRRRERRAQSDEPGITSRGSDVSR